jgi:hypothetical protein
VNTLSNHAGTTIERGREMKEFKGIDAAFNLFMYRFGGNELWMQCDRCGEKIRENISAHKCEKKHPIEGEWVDIGKIYCKDTPKKG